MSVEVKLALRREFRVPTDRAGVFAVLADVPYSVSHFPDVARLADQGENVFRWELEPISALGVRHQVIYTCRYASDASRGTVAWTPVSDGGNAEFSGQWQLRGERDTEIRFVTDGTLQIPAPGLLALMVTPVVKEIFENMIDEYVRNLSATFGGSE